MVGAAKIFLKLVLIGCCRFGSSFAGLTCHIANLIVFSNSSFGGQDSFGARLPRSAQAIWYVVIFRVLVLVSDLLSSLVSPSWPVVAL